MKARFLAMCSQRAKCEFKQQYLGKYPLYVSYEFPLGRHFCVAKASAPRWHWLLYPSAEHSDMMVPHREMLRESASVYLHLININAAFNAFNELCLHSRNKCHTVVISNSFGNIQVTLYQPSKVDKYL